MGSCVRGFIPGIPEVMPLRPVGRCDGARVCGNDCSDEQWGIFKLEQCELQRIKKLLCRDKGSEKAL